MRKIFTTLSILLLTTFAFTSCEKDEDVEESMYLTGQWYGDWGMYYTYEYRGRIYTFNSFDTDIVFYPDYDYAPYGYGYQVDWYDEGPYERMSFRFYWEIRNGIIYLTYPGYPEYNADIYDYRLSSNRFTGYFNSSSSMFTMRKIADYYDWNYYYSWDYHYWYNNNWSWGGYYSSSRAASSTNDSTSSTPLQEEGKIISIGNRRK
ncbi:MAG: hypothetical protein UDK36_06250 [Bacteroidaceae bacterium]|nr:hypothetical protein [Bacteroidaceae bacterium]